jgi:adenosylmethionine-8-amino-7-oxononanoate aminotransferase
MRTPAPSSWPSVWCAALLLEPKCRFNFEVQASLAPGDLNHVFFTASGGEAVESAIKLIKQYFKLTGQPSRHKVISRAVAYHGTTQGALSITGIPAAKIMFEPLITGHFKVPNTNFYRAPPNHRCVHGTAARVTVTCRTLAHPMPDKT